MDIVNMKDPFMRISLNRLDGGLHHYFLNALASYSTVKELIKAVSFDVKKKEREVFENSTQAIIDTALEMLKPVEQWKLCDHFELDKKEVLWNMSAKSGLERYTIRASIKDSTVCFLNGSDHFIKEWHRPSVFSHEDFETEIERELIAFSHAFYIIHMEHVITQDCKFIFSNAGHDFACSQIMTNMTYMGNQALSKIVLGNA